jgi:3-methyladenine DNA glycosylase AlkD
LRVAQLKYRQAHAALAALGNPRKADFFRGFFKTGKGEYGEGDRFLGIAVPEVRALAKKFRDLPLKDSARLLRSPFNEERLLGLIILVNQYQKGDEVTQAGILREFLAHRHRVNNWNLVDASAPYILGAHLLKRDRSLLYELARSRSLWDRRIAVLATFAFIKAGDLGDSFKLTSMLLKDSEDLLYKACGWMLREIGKRDTPALEKFLQRHRLAMPRTMLRYAIERFPKARRRQYLSKD